MEMHFLRMYAWENLLQKLSRTSPILNQMRGRLGVGTALSLFIHGHVQDVVM